MTSRREIENKVERLESNGGSSRSLRQSIPYEWVEQWEELTGNDMSHVYGLGDQHD